MIKNWVLMQSINIPRLVDGQRATVALRRECEPDSQTEFASWLSRASVKMKRTPRGCPFLVKQLGFDAKHQYSSLCRRSASYRRSAAGMRTRFANGVCELVEPCFHQNDKDTTRVSFSFWWKQLGSNQ